MSDELITIIKGIPRHWRILEQGADGFKFIHKTEKISVIISVNVEADCKKWIHLSLARPNRMPDYYDIKRVKEDFLPDKKASMVWPENDKYINIHSFCLHLFHCLEDDGLPEFSGFREDYQNGKARTL